MGYRRSTTVSRSCHQRGVHGLSASGISPGFAWTRRRASSSGWPARSIAAERLLAARPIGLGVGERADPAPLGEAQRRLPGAATRLLARVAAILLVDPGGAQRRAHPPLADSRAAPARRRGPRRRPDRRHSRAPPSARPAARPAARRPRSSRARAACAGDRRRAWRGSSRSGRHSSKRPLEALFVERRADRFGGDLFSLP